jgi:hypothetical protein
LGNSAPVPRVITVAIKLLACATEGYEIFGVQGVEDELENVER